ncbi:MAG: hypothetical protein ACOCVA_05835 [Prolixibacteraceae bacterium]
MKLQTSNFTAQYEKGALRYVKSGKIEVLRMIYSAVRDSNWGTLNPKIIKEEFENRANGFQLKVWIKYQEKDIEFEAFFRITGKENRLEFEMEGDAKSDFLTNRIGFCVLHPIKECAGKTCTVFHPDGTFENAIFPELISPDQPMKNVSGLEWNPAKGLKAKLNFSGNVFEMEDQRNWSDASYKTYCRPLELPFPYQVKKGEKIRQKIILEIQGHPQQETKNDCISFRIDEKKRFKIPEIGVCSTSRKEPLEQSEAEILKQLPLHHLRGEIKLYKKNWKLDLQKVVEESVRLELSLFLVLYFSDNYKNELSWLGVEIHKYSVQVKYVLVVGNNHLFDNELFNKSFQGLTDLFPNAKFGAGVNAYFAELNRNRPQTERAGFISYTVCPQVHAFDDATLVENLEGQKYTVETAKNLFPGKPIFVAPVTLKQRFNVVATSIEPELKSGELPDQVDARQNTVLAAQWLLGSLKFLAQSGADLITYFETVGWRGFIQGNCSPPLPEKFSARKGDIFPSYYLLKEIAGFDSVAFSESSNSLVIEGIVLSKDFGGSGFEKIIIANFTQHLQQVKLEGNFKNYRIKKSTGNKMKYSNKKIIEISSNEIIVIERENVKI